MRANLEWNLVTRLVGSCLALTIMLGIASCEQQIQATPVGSAVENNSMVVTDGPLSEVNIPASIARLAPSLDKFQPQVSILSPKPDQTLTDDRVTVKLAVKDLPLFKQPELGLGNHLHVILDKQTYQGVYDLSQPLVFKNLAAGTHSLRVFASRSWHESFKNTGAYAQVSFNVLTKTAENNPDPNKPLLTYSRPTGTYGAEPIMLDYYLTNVPSSTVTQGSQDNNPNWRIRATVNDQRFILDRWAPVYLQGFKPGKNWVRLELVDDRGNPIPNVYNDSVSIITYDPQTKDTLAKLIRGEIDPNLERSLVDPNYVAIKPLPVPTPAIAPTPALTPVPTPVTPTPAPIPVPVISPSLVVIAPAPVVKPSPSPVVIAPAPVAKPVPSPTVQTPAIIAPEPVEPIEEVKPIIEPIVQPSPIPAPTTEIQPAPVAKTLPAETPAPEVVKAAPIIPMPQPTPAATPKPAPINAPVPTIVPEIIVKNDPALAEPVGTRIDPPKSTPPVPSQPPQNEQQIQPPTENQIKSPQMSPPEISLVAPTPTTTWQTQANDLRKAAGVKIRAFTNTIPSKAQRFGHNVQIWVGNAINQIQAWRAAHVD